MLPSLPSVGNGTHEGCELSIAQAGAAISGRTGATLFLGLRSCLQNVFAAFAAELRGCPCAFM